jgi:integrase
MNDLLKRTLEEVRISEGAVFRSRTGQPYKSINMAFYNAMKKHMEIDDFTFHELRHTFASRLVMGGVDLPTVKRLMGHKELSMTLRYAHLSDEHMQRAVDVLVPTNFTTCRDDEKTAVHK